MAKLNIKAVVASAGAGKTYRIVEEIASEVALREPEEIVATTFTVKAAAELIERSRAQLFQTGQADKAARLLGARFGTVNAVCGQIVAENAIGLGRSPRAEVVAEDSARRLFAIAADAAIEQHAPVLNDIGEAFGLYEPRRPTDAEVPDWRKTVRDLIGLARANGIAPEALKRSAERSVETFMELLPEPASEGSARLDRDLSDAVAAALGALPPEPSATALKHVDLLRRVDAAFRRGERITWPDWARLTKVACAKTKDGAALVAALANVTLAARRHFEHPRLREHCEAYARSIFDCAAEALTAYQLHKAQRGLLDFVDQEALALEVLRVPELAAAVGERVGRLFVDEFQDSSPLQVAIFTALAPLVDGSTWVGDPKQAIYGFRNADSALTQAAFAGVMAEAEGEPEILAKSWRSRQDIVDFVNAAFPPALAAMGLNPAENAFVGTARTEDGFDGSALSTWWLDGKLELQYAALAAAVRDAIAADSGWVVGHKAYGVRPMRAGDVAVLCKDWFDIGKVAAALSRIGVKVSVERAGLARTPHVELVMAAFRWVTDPSDRLALAELARFLADDPESDAWLLAAAANDQAEALRAAVSIAPQLEELRQRMLSLTPADMVDAIMLLPAVIRRIETWGEMATRFEDLEALRGFARTYEADCAAAGVPATLSGLVLALAGEEPKRPASLREDAVTLMTYHGAKGLEWPCVIMTGLSKDVKQRLFEPVAAAEGVIDWRNPLADRWIRYWPWPYGGQSTNVGLDAAAAASPLGLVDAARARDEAARLLYVGATRARDHLILAAPISGTLKWLAVLNAGGADHVLLPAAQGQPLRAGEHAFAADVRTLAADDEVVTRPPSAPFVRVTRPVQERPPLHRRPSEEAEGVGYRVVERIALGPRLPFVGSPDMRALGEAVHAIIACDRPEAGMGARLARSQAILDRWGVHQVSAKDVLLASGRLYAEIAKRWPQATTYRETPVSARWDDQLVKGRIDLLVEHTGGFAVVDHKSFPGSRDMWEGRAIGYGPQLGLYAQALDRARPGTSCELFVHMPIVGALLRLAPIEENA